MRRNAHCVLFFKSLTVTPLGAIFTIAGIFTLGNLPTRNFERFTYFGIGLIGPTCRIFRPLITKSLKSLLVSPSDFNLNNLCPFHLTRCFAGRHFFFLRMYSLFQYLLNSFLRVFHRLL